MTIPRDSYVWNYREQATLLSVSESLAEVGLEPLTVGSMRKNLTIELSWHLLNWDLDSKFGHITNFISAIEIFRNKTVIIEEYSTENGTSKNKILRMAKLA